jgi:hypothetical protein
MKNDIVLLEHLKVLQQKLSSTKVPNRKKIIKESLEIIDISSQSNFKGGQIKNNKYFIFHHTAGRGDAPGVIKILNCRKRKNNKPGCMILGVQFIIDREGKVYRGLPDGSSGGHVVRVGKGPLDVTNSNSKGVEIIAKNDKDVLIKQCKSALLLVKDQGFSLNQIIGHGEVSTEKMVDEGQKCKRYANKYWNTPEDQLPDTDDELGKDEDPKVKDNEIFKDKKDNSEYNDNKSDDDEVDVEDDTKDVKTTTTEPKKTNPFDFFKRLGGILKNKEDLKIEEDVQRIKNLLK